MSLTNIFIISVFATLALFVASASALTLQWDRNTEADMAAYTVYGCTTGATCVVTKTLSQKLGALPQVAVGVVPSFVLPNGVEGRTAITASDLTSNESALSVSVPFGDITAPAIPTNLRVVP